MISDINKIKPEDADEQIKIREKLLTEMVGNLYPSILNSEIEKLKSIRDDFLNENEMKI